MTTAAMRLESTHGLEMIDLLRTFVRVARSERSNELWSMVTA